MKPLIKKCKRENCENDTDFDCMMCASCKDKITSNDIPFCELTGNGDVRAFGYSCIEDAKKAADIFFRSECDEDGIIINNGCLVEWGYPLDPKPTEWIDYYFFRSMDSEPLPREAYSDYY